MFYAPSAKRLVRRGGVRCPIKNLMLRKFDVINTIITKDLHQSFVYCHSAKRSFVLISLPLLHGQTMYSFNCAFIDLPSQGTRIVFSTKRWRSMGYNSSPNFGMVSTENRQPVCLLGHQQYKGIYPTEGRENRS